MPLKPSTAAKYKLQSGITGVLVLAIVAVFNYLGAHYHKRWDFTGTKLYSLSKKTLKVLENMEDDFHATYFYKNDPYDEFGDLLKEYDVACSKFHLAMYDLDKRPEIAKYNHVKDYNTVVLQCRNRTKKIVSPDEQKITGAIVQLVKGQKKKAYFTVGHGERSFLDFERTGMSKMIDLIESQNIGIDTIILATAKAIPDDCNVLVVNGGEKSWTPHEIEIVSVYADSGGSLFLNVDESRRELNRLLSKWNVSLGKATVIDLTASLHGASPGITVLNKYGYHETTRGFRLMTAFVMPGAVNITDDSAGMYNVTFILKSSSQSWGEKGRIDKDLDFDEGTDIPGPIPFGVAIQPKDGKTPKVVLIGDSDYASNAYMGFPGNSDLYLNILSWLTEQEDLIAVRARELSYQRIDITQNQARLFFGLVLFLLPLSIVGAGLWVWVRRKRT